jgi:hypothetical protein
MDQSTGANRYMVPNVSRKVTLNFRNMYNRSITDTGPITNRNSINITTKDGTIPNAENNANEGGLSIRYIDEIVQLQTIPF